MATSRRDFLKTLGGAAAVASLSGCATFVGKPSSKRPPNILFLMTDQHNPKTMGHLGDPNAVTPNLDSLAEKGTVFTQTYTQNPVCVPARMSILTGLYSHTHGSMTNWNKTTRNHTSFAQIMRANGYKTGCFGHLHITDRDDLDWDALNPRKDWPKRPNPGDIKPIGAFTQKGIVGRAALHDEMYTKEWKAKEETIQYMTEWRDGPRGALVMGLRHGLSCLGCCWVLMSLLFVLGVMNPLWIAALAGFVLVEKVAPKGHMTSRT